MGRVMDTLPPTSYVSRVIALPPAVAAQVFDACLADWQQPELELAGHGLPDPSALRSLPGRLRTGRVGGTYDVELELNAWSRSCAEVAVRLVGRKRSTARYLDGAGAVVDALAAELELRGLLALHPSHVTGTTSRQELAASAWL